MNGRVGAYILPGDPVWLRSSLRRYYHRLDELVVLVPAGGRGWTGRPLPVGECLSAVNDIDVRRLAREVHGEWLAPDNPMAADTAQRQAGIDALGDSVDWIIQIDNDEILPDLDALFGFVPEATRHGCIGIEWPMRVLFRRIGHNQYLEVVGKGDQPVYEYPGAILLRSGAKLRDARRPEGAVLRVLVGNDDVSLQNTQALADGEVRLGGLSPDRAIIHNSWGRTPRAVWRKTRTWGHASGLRGAAYYLTTWWPARLRWRHMRNFHPFADGLWPALRKTTLPPSLLHGADDL